MTAPVDVEHLEDQPPLAPESEPESDPPRRRRRLWKIAVAFGAVLLVVLAAGALWLVVGRDKAEQLDTNDALADFRAAAGSPSDAAGLPDAGVYAATASGKESIGLPGFDEDLGPAAPVTVTHQDGGCFKYRADFNSHHWRSWTFCPTDTATFSLTELDAWTARKAPGLDIATLTTYTCSQPLDVLWQGATAGETRTGACTGTSDLDDSITDDAGVIEVLDLGTLSVGGDEVDVLHARTTDTFSRAQTGTEVDEWWLDATTGLPLKIVADSSLTGGPSDYSESWTLELSTLTPAT